MGCPTDSPIDLSCTHTSTFCIFSAVHNDGADLHTDPFPHSQSRSFVDLCNRSTPNYVSRGDTVSAKGFTKPNSTGANALGTHGKHRATTNCPVRDDGSATAADESSIQWRPGCVVPPHLSLNLRWFSEDRGADGEPCYIVSPRCLYARIDTRTYVAPCSTVITVL